MWSASARVSLPELRGIRVANVEIKHLGNQVSNGVLEEA